AIAEFLQLHLSKTQPVKRRAHRTDIDLASLLLHLDQRSALEVDAEIEPMGEIEQQCKNRKRCRHRKTDPAEAHEVKLRVVRYQPQVRDHAEEHEQAKDSNSGNAAIDEDCCGCHCVLQTGTVLGRHQRTHIATINRVSVKAVNSVVRMPIPNVTAKPRTAPVPMKNNTAAAMNVVMFESRMVASARLKPASMAAMGVRPPRSSSRMR